MPIYARVYNNIVMELVTPLDGFTIEDSYYRNIAAQFVDVSDVSPRPEPGWTASGSGDAYTFSPPTTPEPTIAQQAQTLLMNGLAINSAGNSDLNATYPCDTSTQQQLNSEITSLLLNSTFTDGGSTIDWLDNVGHVHTFSIDQFKALATMVAGFVTGCIRCINGQSTTLPPDSADIP